MKHKTFSKAFLSLFMMLFFGSVGFLTQPAYAEIYCDPRIKARSEQDRQNSIMKDIAKFEKSYGSANSFDSLYCGAQISTAFDQLGSSLVGNINNQVDNMINQLFQKACKAAIAPIQNAAAQTCVPNFSQSYFDQNLINNAFNQRGNNGQTQAVCLMGLLARSQGRGVDTQDIMNCLNGGFNELDVLSCIIALFSRSGSQNITQNDVMFCLNQSSSSSNQLNYCPGTQLIQVTPVISTGGFNGGGGSSYPELFW